MPQPQPWDLAIVLDGETPHAGWSRLLAGDATVVAADGGARHGIDEGVVPDYCVGDFDSLSTADLNVCRQSGAVIVRHPEEKDDTDFALAIEIARNLDAGKPNESRLLVVGGSGGRLDHELGNLMVLAAAATSGFAVSAAMGRAFVQMATPDNAVHLVGAAGGLVSLIPMGGPVSGVITRGLQWQLDRADLEWGSARGVSNVIEEPSAAVEIADGTLLVCEPNAVPDLLFHNERKTK